MLCAFCNEKINSNSIRQGGEMFCSLECANLATGYDTSKEEGYFEEESPMLEHFEDYEE